jgi:hypothetical protein
MGVVLLLSCTHEARAKESAKCEACPPPPNGLPKAQTNRPAGQGFWCQGAVSKGTHGMNWYGHCFRDENHCDEAGIWPTAAVGSCRREDVAWCFHTESDDEPTPQEWCSITKTSCVNKRKDVEENRFVADECQLAY